jgi:hypothetical protein
VVYCSINISKDALSLAESAEFPERNIIKNLYLTKIRADNGWIKEHELLTRIVILQRFRSDTSSPSGIKFSIYPL